jgi:hypothetical protein
MTGVQPVIGNPDTIVDVCSNPKRNQVADSWAGLT